MTWNTLNDVVTTVRACRGQTPYGQTQQKNPIHHLLLFYIFLSPPLFELCKADVMFSGRLETQNCNGRAVEKTVSDLLLNQLSWASVTENTWNLTMFPCLFSLCFR